MLTCSSVSRDFKWADAFRLVRVIFKKSEKCWRALPSPTLTRFHPLIFCIQSLAAMYSSPYLLLRTDFAFENPSSEFIESLYCFISFSTCALSQKVKFLIDSLCVLFDKTLKGFKLQRVLNILSSEFFWHHPQQTILFTAYFLCQGVKCRIPNCC